MKNLFVLLLLVLLFLFKGASAQRTIFELPWGHTDAAAGLLQLPEGFYGPQSFKVTGDEIQILDNGNGRIKIIKNGRLRLLLPAAQAARDFLLFSDKDFVLDVNNELLHFSRGKLAGRFGPGAKKIIRSLQKTGKGELEIRLSDGTSILRRMGTKTQSQQAAQQGAGNELCRTFRRSASLGELQILTENGNLKSRLEVRFPQNNLASFSFLTQDRQKNVFLHTELFESQLPLKIKRQVLVFDSLGNQIAAYAIPLNSYAYIQNDLFADASGRLYQLYASDSGIRILKWTLAEAKRHLSGAVIPYPKIYEEQDTPPENTDDFHQNTSPENPRQNETPFTNVTPDQALATGDSYVQLHWNCASQNLTNGLIKDSYDIYVRTPDWLYVGNVQRIPYKWGGFQTVQQFVDGISAGKYAGDNYTSKSSGTSSAVGVDCSGFVSRCWHLSSHYSTMAMPDITEPYDSWDQTRPGDACHKVGHVRLIVAHAPDGSLDMVESASFNWRVSYTNYRYSAITQYTPRYYINMEGTPGKIPQPVLQSVLDSDSTHLFWQAAARETIKEFVLEQADDAQNWTDVVLLDADSSHFCGPQANGQAQYFRMHSVSTDGTTAGVSSDVYGIYNYPARAKVLLVDGFDRTEDSKGSWPHVYHSFAAVHGRILQKLGVPFETVANEALINGRVSLNDYEIVIWILGDESTLDETFDSNEQALAADYLRSGGNLFVSGSEVAWDLDYKGSEQDKNFIKQYLKASMQADNAASHSVSGVSSTPFQGLSIHFDDGSHGVYEEDYPDALNLQNGGQAALKYANGKNAAVYYSGLFPEGAGSGQLFYMGFPFETIYNENERSILMSSVLSWFGIDITVIGSGNEQNPREFELSGNYPNPFNGQTTIRFFLPAGGLVETTVYNSLGQKVRSIKKVFQNGGKQEQLVHAVDLASGEYFYRITFDGGKGKQHRFGRFMLIK